MILYADIPGERLDAFLARCAENLSRSAAQKLIEEGQVKRNGKPGKKNGKLSPGDRVDVTPVKQVKKIPNGKPGMVIYHSYRTVIANPYADIVVDALNAEKKESLEE